MQDSSDSDSIKSDFELLCSMSPKLDKLVKKRYPKRGNTILSLKKNVRRSSIYDQAEPTIKNESLELVEPSSTDNSPTESPRKHNMQGNSLIVISDTDIEGISMSSSSNSKSSSKQNCAKKLHPFDSPELLLSNSVEAIFISERKKFDIESWIDSVTETINNNTKFSETSSIQGGHYNTEKSAQAANSTFIESAYKRFDEIFKHKKLDHRGGINNKASTKYVEDTSSEESFHLKLSNENKKQSNDANSNEILSTDDTKVIEIIDDSLTNIDDKKVLQIIEDSLTNICIEGRSFDVNTNNNEKNPMRKMDLQSNHSFKVISDMKLYENSEINPTLTAVPDQSQETAQEIFQSGNYSHNQSELTPSKNDATLCCENEIHSMLDEIYGNSWRHNQHSILPQSERKLKSSSKERAIKKMPKTEEKPKKPSLLYKNPHVEPEKTNSNNLLKTLQKARVKAALESPWVSKLASLCDPDSSSEEPDKNKLQPTKLDFEDDNTISSVSKNKKEDPSWQSSDGSDKENVSDTSDWDQYLENKLKKPNFKDQVLHKHINDTCPKDVKNKVKEPAQGKIKNKKLIKKKQVDLDKVPVSIDEEPTTNKGPTTNKQLLGTHTFLSSLSSNIPITECDMAARIYRNNFKKFRNELAKKLFNIFNEKVFDKALPEDTDIVWNDRLRGTAGRCDCVKVTRRTGIIERTAKILLSSKILDKADRLRDTLIHEMCHAATWIVNQISDGHGHFWQSWAHKAMITFPELPPIKRCHDYVINTKYTYRCTGCSYSIGRHSKSLDIERKRCGYCYGKFEVLLNRTSKMGELKRVPVTPKKEPTGFALFVKENYAVHKSHQLSHAEVMRLLGQKFAELKTD